MTLDGNATQFDYVEITASETAQLLHRDFPAATRLFAYGVGNAAASWPGPTIVAQRDRPVVVRVCIKPRHV